jgi:hypothetical protein
MPTHSTFDNRYFLQRRCVGRWSCSFGGTWEHVQTVYSGDGGQSFRFIVDNCTGIFIQGKADRPRLYEAPRGVQTVLEQINEAAIQENSAETTHSWIRINKKWPYFVFISEVEII